MYNIKQASARAGVSIPVLRAWERRYGIIRPDRTASGYRLFDDDDIARIRVMRRLVEQGWSPSAAASGILGGSIDVRAEDHASALEGPGVDGDAGQRAPGLDEGRAAAADIVARFVEGARSLEPSSISATLDDLFARGSFERVASELLFPALVALGDAWAAGTVGIAGEHLASTAVLRRLGQAFDAAGPGPAMSAGRIIVGMPPGARHELGALAFAVAARRAGLPVAYLGADLPADHWVVAADQAAAAVIGAVTRRDRTAALGVAARLHAAYPDLVIASGGRSAPSGPDALRLPNDLVESVAALQAALPG